MISPSFTLRFSICKQTLARLVKYIAQFCYFPTGSLAISPTWLRCNVVLGTRRQTASTQTEGYEELDQQHDYSGNNVDYEGYQQNVSLKVYNPADNRSALYQRFYKQLHKAPAGCVVLSVSNQSMSEDEDFSNCVHRNMPKDHAMDFVMAENGRGLGKRMQQKDPAETGARAVELVDDYLEREKVEKHAVPSDTRQLLFFLADGVHLYPEELSTITEYLHNRQDHLQATSTETSDGPLPGTKMLPPGLGKPPPLLPTPSGPRGRETPPGMREHSATPLMTSPGPYPKTKPPPLLSMHQGQGPPHGPPFYTRPPRSVTSRTPHYHGPRGVPPSLKSLHMGPQPGLFTCPGGLPNTPRR